MKAGRAGLVIVASEATMRERVLAGALAGLLVAGAAGLAVVAAGNSGDGGSPRPLPVLGAAAGGQRALDEAAGAPDASASLIHADVTYEISPDLPSIDGEASAWRVESSDGAAAAARLADALGLSGDVEEGEGGLWWVVVDGDARLEVQRQPGLPWYFGRNLDTPVVREACAEAEFVEPGSEPGDEPAGGVRCPEPEPVPAVQLPSREDAGAIARRVLDAAGVDSAEPLRVEDVTDFWSITVEPTVGGLPTTGFGTYLAIGPDTTVMWANGWLGVPQQADSYPLIGTQAAVERLQEQGGGYVGIGGVERLAAEGAPDEECVPGPAVDCIAPEPFPEPEPVVVRVTDVRLGLMFVPWFDAPEAWFVPAYLFELDGGQGGEAPVIGVPDEFLVQPAVVEPDPGVVEPGGSGGGSSGSTGTGSVSCAGTESAVADAVSLEVCQQGAAVAGEPVLFDLTAYDADSGVRDDCGSPVADFGDEAGGTAVCDIGCASTDPGPGELKRTFEHLYERPGTYTATFSLYGCGEQMGEVLAEVSLEVAVAS